MSEVKLTPEQNEAIHSSGKNILVSASAGSGKLLLWLKELSRKSNKELKLIDFSFPHLQKSSKRITDAA